MSTSYFVDLKNLIFRRTQKSFAAKMFNESLLGRNIDTLSFFFIVMTLLSSLVAQSSVIGLFASVVIVLYILKMFFKKGEKIILAKIDKVLIIYFLVVFVSVCGSSMFMLSFHGFLKTLIYFLFYFAVAQFYIKNPSKIIPTIWISAVFTSAEGLYSIIQGMFGVEAISGWQDYSNINPEDAIQRVYGTLKPYNPNLLGGYLLAGFPSILAMAFLNFKNGHKKTFLWWIFFALTTVFAIFNSGCRGAYLGLFAIIAAVIFYLYYFVKTHWGFERIKKRYKSMAAGIFAAIGAVIVFSPPIFKRILSIFAMREDSSTSFRMNVYQSCCQMFQDNPFLGIGVGNQNFRETYGLYMKTGFDALGAYSVYLETAVESGIFGLLVFLLFIGLIFLHGIMYLRRESDLTLKIITMSVLLTVLGVMTHGLVDTIYFRPQVQIIFWINIAILTTLLKRQQKF